MNVASILNVILFLELNLCSETVLNVKGYLLRRKKKVFKFDVWPVITGNSNKNKRAFFEVQKNLGADH